MEPNAKWVKIMIVEDEGFLEQKSPNHLYTMVRRGNQRVFKKIKRSGPVQSVAVATQTPALPSDILGGRSGSNPNVTEIEACPQCHTRFNSTSVRRAQEVECGHIKCGTCFIRNDCCPQCNDERPRRGASNIMASRTSNDMDVPTADDLLPQRLTAEELSFSGSFITSDQGRIDKRPRKEIPVTKATLLARLKLYKATDSRERAKGRHSRSEPMGTSPKSSKFAYQRDKGGKNLCSMKQSSEIGNSSSTMQLRKHSATATFANKLLSHARVKYGRYSTGGSNLAAFTAVRSQSSGSTPAGSAGKEPVQSAIVPKPKLGLPRQETKNDKIEPFAMTTSQFQKNSVITSTSINEPLLGPSDALPTRTEESPVHFSDVSASGDDSLLLGWSSNDDSNLHSMENRDPLDISNDLSHSNPAERQISKAEPSKKRSPVTIYDHITIISASGEPPLYQCNVCVKSFKTKAHISYHEFCKNGEKPYKCEECGKGCVTKAHYEYHLRTHTGERPYVCPDCGKGFTLAAKVKQHMRLHTGEKTFICEQCGRGFANAQRLRSHFLIHTGERPFACQYCDKRFMGKTILKKHLLTHTGEKPFSCNHCGKSFGLKWTLDAHLRTHSTERPFACDQCPRAFSSDKDLRRHLTTHSCERPFKCWICGTAFRRKDNLHRHIRNTHNKPQECQTTI